MLFRAVGTVDGWIVKAALMMPMFIVRNTAKTFRTGTSPALLQLAPTVFATAVTIVANFTATEVSLLKTVGTEEFVALFAKLTSRD